MATEEKKAFVRRQINELWNEGKIAESWEFYDVMGMTQQLGVIPYPEEQLTQA